MNTKISIALLVAGSMIACFVGLKIHAARPYLIVLALSLLVAAFLTLGWDLSKRVWWMQKKLTQLSLYNGVEINAVLAIRQRFPGIEIPTSLWSMCFPNLLVLLDSLDTHRPRKIVEFGSGISTIVCALWIKEQGAGELVSYDHDSAWAGQTKKHIERLGLSDVCTVNYLELKRQTFKESTVDWYDFGSQVERIKAGVDMVVVDGPPGYLEESGICRVPAVFALQSILSKNAVVLLDDANRDGEKEVLRIWKNQVPNVEIVEIETVTGIAVVKFQ